MAAAIPTSPAPSASPRRARAATAKPASASRPATPGPLSPPMSPFARGANRYSAPPNPRPRQLAQALASSDPAARLVLPFLTQGVTTAFIGVDGGGDPDIARTFGIAKAGASGDSEAGLGQSTRDFGINFAAYVGLGAVRAKVVGAADRAPTPAELGQMVGLVDKAMCDGALGLSTGLFYAPQSFAKRGEVVALAKAAAAKGGIYDSHLRDESSYTIGLTAAVDEALSIGRDADIPVHIAHRSEEHTSELQ